MNLNDDICYPFWGLVGRILPIVKIIFLYSIGKILFTLKI